MFINMLDEFSIVIIMALKQNYHEEEKELFEILRDYSHFTALCVSLSLVQVRERNATGEYTYINGFSNFVEEI